MFAYKMLYMYVHTSFRRVCMINRIFVILKKCFSLSNHRLQGEITLTALQVSTVVVISILVAMVVEFSTTTEICYSINQ